jgi:hypothetical protein
VAEPASAEYQRCRVVPGELRVMLAQRGEPVLRSPPRGVGGVGDDHRQAGVRGHLDEAVAELPGRDSGDRAAERAPAAAPRWAAAVPFAAFGAGGGEV